MAVPVSRQLSAVLAVGGVFLDAGSSLPEGEDALDRFESLDSYNASYTIEVTRDNETETWTGNRTVRPSTGQFYERFEPPDGNTTIGVNNGSVTWLYDTGSNTVRTYSADRGRLGGQHIVTNSSGLTANASEDFVTIASLQYVSDRASFVVQKSNTTFEQNETDGEQVDVAGRTGRYRQVAGQAQVSWHCSGHRYAVSGELTRETLLDVADSVACE